jgi:hypothetical protein
MKACRIGMVLSAILMVVAGAGFGIAQAGVTQSDNPAWTPQDEEALDQYKDFLAGPVETRNFSEPVQVAQSSVEFVPEGNWSGNDWQIMEPVETGGIPPTVSGESWMREYGTD